MKLLELIMGHKNPSGDSLDLINKMEDKKILNPNSEILLHGRTPPNTGSRESYSPGMRAGVPVNRGSGKLRSITVIGISCLL